MVLEQRELAATGNLVPSNHQTHPAGRSSEADSCELEYHQLRVAVVLGGFRPGGSCRRDCNSTHMDCVWLTVKHFLCKVFFFSSLLSAFSQLNKGFISAHLTELHGERDVILNYWNCRSLFFVRQRMYQVGAEIALAVQKYILNSRTSQALKFWVKFKEILPEREFRM